MGRRVFAWALLGPAVAWAEVTPGGTSQLSLRWSDPSNLAPLSQSELEARLSERLGHAAFDGNASERALSVSWQGTAEQCHVELQLVRGNQVEGTRRIESPSGDCRSLGPALLTVAALLIESRPEPAPEPVEDEPAERSTPPAEPAPTPAQPAAAARAEPLLLASLGGELTTGHAPKAELGPAAALVWTPVSHLRLGLRGVVFLPQQYGATPGMKLTHMAAAVLACGMPLSGSFSLGICGNVGLHSWASAGVGLLHPDATRAHSWTLGLGARAEWRLSRRLWWVADAGANAATAPLYFYFTPPAGGETVLFRQTRLAPFVFLGLTLELP